MITRMEHIHYLNSQDNHYPTARLSRRRRHSQLQILTTVDHVFEHVIDGVLMDAGTFGDNLTNVATHAAQKTGGAWTRSVLRIGREDAEQITIVNCRPVKVVFFALA